MTTPNHYPEQTVPVEEWDAAFPPDVIPYPEVVDVRVTLRRLAAALFPGTTAAEADENAAKMRGPGVRCPF